MARTGRPKTELTLTEEEREQLGRWSRRAKSSQALALRSRIVLACAKGTDNKGVAAQLNCARPERLGATSATSRRGERPSRGVRSWTGCRQGWPPGQLRYSDRGGHRDAGCRRASVPPWTGRTDG